MMDNPYSGLLSMMQEQGAKNNPPTICLGEVITPEPLTIKTEELVLDHDDVLVSDVLVGGYKRELTETGQGYDKGFIESEVERRIKDCLSVNEKIESCTGFDISLVNDKLNVSFTVNTVFGEVAINV